MEKKTEEYSMYLFIFLLFNIEKVSTSGLDGREVTGERMAHLSRCHSFSDFGKKVTLFLSKLIQIFDAVKAKITKICK